MSEAGLHISSCEENPIAELDQESKTLKITAHRQSYVPSAIFKCFVKMAIAVAPERILAERLSQNLARRLVMRRIMAT